MSTEESSDGAFRDWNEVHEHLERRASIEQTTGMLMFVYGMDADEAVAVLRSQAHEHDIKLPDIAEQVQKDLFDLARSKGPARRLAFDGLLSTAHRRIAAAAARRQ